MRFAILLTTGILLSCLSARAQFNVEPYLQDATPTSMRVMWENASEGTATLEWGPDESLGNTEVSEGVASPGGAMHDVLLDGLSPSSVLKGAVVWPSQDISAPHLTQG